MRHNLRNLLHLDARTPSVRAVRAWRRLLPDWTPTLDAHRDLDTRPHEHVAAVRIVAEGWSPEDARWDVLMALLEYERREERMRWLTAEAALGVQTIEDIRSQETCRWCEESDDERCFLHREDDDDDQVRLREDHLAGDLEREVPLVREVRPQAAAVLPDTEPVQPGPGDGPDEDADADPDRSARSRPRVERVSAGVYRVRTLWGDGLWGQR